ncbi:MerR family transcriptional regulator [Goodfellowiella coeruleoviolacea]|uniref:DNA-binding transcriptional regulator, MerR family n=1 Tax=Goodfellowiella coeruleoviolacea TaxID=334858 RepID=A0AAE3KFX8_9PSEU|nr:MerR family transcriptional regulator [Goodfellowiella coeruleoviolacea]MCP2166806.1 DNA-binding transcriptional regulator, MerR family [Goodfellowiella coeruleoviolacea]
MRIGELSRRTGVSIRLLRYYGQQGLLRPVRRASGYREYTESDVDVVRRIRTLLAAGLSTTTIAEVLPCLVDDGAKLAPACPGLIPHLLAERDRISGAIAELAASRAQLDAVLTATPPTPTTSPDYGLPLIPRGDLPPATRAS